MAIETVRGRTLVSSVKPASAFWKQSRRFLGKDWQVAYVFDDAVAPFNFGVVDRDSVDANNPATVNLNPAPANFEDIDVSDVELPNGP